MQRLAWTSRLRENTSMGNEAMTERMAVRRDAAALEVPAAYLMLVVAMLSWAGNVTVGRALAGWVPPFGLSLMRWSIAFAVVLPFAARELVAKRQIIMRDWRILLVLGLFGVSICNSLSYLGLQWTTALNAALLNSAGPMLTLAASFLFFRERATLRQVAGVTVSLVGVLVIVLRGDIAALLALSINRGDIAILVGVLSWSFYTVLLRRRPAELSPVAFLVVLFAIGVITLLPLYLTEAALGWSLPTALPALLGYGFVGLFPAVIAFFGWNRGVASIGANRASLFTHLMPLFAALLAYVFLDERIALFHLVGAALIFLGIFLANRAA
jgi:drug/metabolite transporter (DMT)-like permease